MNIISYRIFDENRRRAAAGLALAAVMAALVPALPARAAQDKVLPVQIEANQAQLNDKTGISVYTGDVKITRGELVLTGSRLVITRQENRSDYIADLTGSPAHLNQGVTDQVEQPITGSAHEIRYLTADQVVTLKGDAVLHRQNDLLRGDTIRYDVQTDKIIANGQGAGNGRVRIIIHPKKKENGAQQ